MRKLVRDRVALLALLRPLGWPTVVGLAVVMLSVTSIPAATAAVSGLLVADVADLAGSGRSVSSVMVPLVAVSVLLVADLVAGSLLVPIRDWAALRVNGHVRSMIRAAVGKPDGIDHLDDQAVLDAASIPVYDTYLWNVGAGAEGQLWLLSRFAGAGASAVVLAMVSVPAAVFELVCVLSSRAILRRQYARVLGGNLGELEAAQRASTYWMQVAATPKGAKEIRLFGFQDWAIDQFATNDAVGSQRVIRLLRAALPRAWVIFGLSALAGGVPFLVLVLMALDGDLSTAQFAVALGAVVGLFNMGAMGFEAFSIEAAVPRLESLEWLRRAQAPREPAREHSHSTSTRVSVPTIDFEDVWFRYPGAEGHVLRGLDLRLEPGQSVAIVGANGVGKTTLVKLLAGFYRPTAGRVLVDGVDLREVDAVEWRTNLAMIFQDFVRYELPVLDNVALAALGAPNRLELARAAAAAAGALEIIEGLPSGWDTVLGPGYENSVELSGGQWQRIALARALYAARVGAKVLLLDEPTASLDVHAEVFLFDQLLDHADGLTSLVISHRFSTVRRAQRIVVLDDGRVAEDGDHATLMAHEGRYAQLYRVQADRFAERGQS